MRIDLPDGQWAEFRDPKSITEGQRRPIKRTLIGLPSAVREQFLSTAQAGERADTDKSAEAMAALAAEQAKLEAMFGPAEQAAMEDVGDLATCAMLTVWSLDLPCPPTPEQLIGLPIPTYDMLVSAAGDFMGALMTGTDFSPNADPARSTPTTP
jgi:hypothetical protein